MSFQDGVITLSFPVQVARAAVAAACVGRASCNLGVNCKVCAHASHDDEQHKERLIQLVENANQLHLNGDLLHVSDASAEEKGVVR